MKINYKLEFHCTYPGLICPFSRVDGSFGEMTCIECPLSEAEESWYEIQNNVTSSIPQTGRINASCTLSI